MSITGKRINKMRCTYTTGYHSVIRRNVVLIDATTRINLENYAKLNFIVFKFYLSEAV